MKRQNALTITCLLSLAISGNSFAADTHSGQAIEQAGKSGSHASASAAHAIAESGQVTSAVSVVPLAVAGSAAAVSTQIANDLTKAATAPIGTPLEITDESIIVGTPPNKALAPKKISDEKQGI